MKLSKMAPCVLLALIIVIPIIIVFADAMASYEWKYTLDHSRETCTVTGIVGMVSKLNIPSEIGGYTVDAIDDYAFSEEPIFEANIPSTVKSIGFGVFDKCYSLSKVNYDGTIEEWFAAIKGTLGSDLPDDFRVYCSDGTIAKDGTVTYK